MLRFCLGENCLTFSLTQLNFQVRTIVVATTTVARGDLTQKIVGVSVQGNILDLAINVMVDRLALFTAGVTKVAREVRTEKLRVQAETENVYVTEQKITYVYFTSIPLNCVVWFLLNALRIEWLLTPWPET